MFAASRVIPSLAAKRAFSTSAANLSKVAVLGAAGGIGQPLSLLMKENKHVTDLSLYDIVNAPGVAADVSHINTKSVVSIELSFWNHAKQEREVGLLIGSVFFRSRATPPRTMA